MNKEELNNVVCQGSSDYEILDRAYEYIEKLEQENNGLNNIINEFEKLFKEELEDGRSEKSKWLMGYYDASKDYLDKLKKMKRGK